PHLSLQNPPPFATKPPTLHEVFHMMHVTQKMFSRVHTVPHLPASFGAGGSHPAAPPLIVKPPHKKFTTKMTKTDAPSAAKC
ncbi:hypothetical protein, partial [Rothia mucilaginosa]